MSNVVMYAVLSWFVLPVVFQIASVSHIRTTYNWCYSP